MMSPDLQTSILYANGPEENWFVLRFDPPTEQCAIRPCHEKQTTYETIEADLKKKEAQMDRAPVESDDSAVVRLSYFLSTR